jgi:hypothetical protein
MSYRVDCDAIFGRFLEHFPYFGLRGPQDAQDLSDSYDVTLQVYREAFGEPPEGTWVSGDARTCQTADVQSWWMLTRASPERSRSETAVIPRESVKERLTRASPIRRFLISRLPSHSGSWG